MSTPESLLDAACSEAGLDETRSFKICMLVLVITDRNRHLSVSALAMRIADELGRAGASPATVKLWVAWSSLRADRETLAAMLAAEGGTLLS